MISIKSNKRTVIENVGIGKTETEVDKSTISFMAGFEKMNWGFIGRYTSVLVRGNG